MIAGSVASLLTDASEEDVSDIVDDAEDSEEDSEDSEAADDVELSEEEVLDAESSITSASPAWNAASMFAALSVTVAS